MTLIDKFNQWKAGAVGRGMNPDGVYNYQCVDVPKDWAIFLWPNKSWIETVGYGNAKDLFNGMPAGYWNKVANNPNDPNQLPKTGDVVVWNGWAANPYGHIAVVISADQGGVTVVQQDGFNQYAPAAVAYIPWGRYPIIGWLSPKYAGSTAPKPSTGNTRIVVNVDGVNGRERPTTDSPIMQQFAAGDELTFDAWANGNDPYGNGNTVWFRGAIAKRWFYSGAFDNPKTDGLSQMQYNPPAPSNPTPTPAPPAGTTRVTGPVGVFARSKPNRNAEMIQSIAGNTEIEIKGYVDGESIEGNNKWFVTKLNGLYTWSGGYTNASVDGFAKLDAPAPTPQPEPTPTPDPSTTPFVPRDPEIIDVEAADFPAWIQFDIVDDPDDTETVNREAFDYYKQKYNQEYQYYPIESGVHWWGESSGGATHDSVVRHMKNTASLGTDFVVSAKRITKFGSLGMKRVSFTTGKRSMYQWTSENDPSLTDDVYLTMGLLHHVVEKKNPRLKNEPIRLHKEFAPTECSDIDVARVREIARKFETGEIDFATGHERAIEPTPEDPTDDPVVVQPTPDPQTPAIVTEIKTIVVNAVVTFVQAFVASWAITGYALDRITLIGLLGAALSLAWNTVLKPFVIKKGWLKQ